MAISGINSTAAPVVQPPVNKPPTTSRRDADGDNDGSTVKAQNVPAPVISAGSPGAIINTKT